MGDLTAFEEKLFDSLKKLIGPEEFGRTKVLGAAVSGGADSVSLLCALAKIKEGLEGGSKKELPEAGQKAKGRPFFPKIVCVTVDHSIRPEEESSGDAAFVKSLCQKLGVECAVKKIERGAVERLAAQRGKGVEEAARFLRYQKFEGFAKESGAQFICLAHNQNDALETLLMRFLPRMESRQGGKNICGRFWTLAGSKSRNTCARKKLIGGLTRQTATISILGTRPEIF